MNHSDTRRRALLTLAAGCLFVTSCSATTAQPVTAPVDITTSVATTPPGTAATTTQPLPARPAGSATPATTPTTAISIPDTAGHGTTTACELITQQEAATALGADPGLGQETPLGETASACTYRSGTSILQLSLTPTGGKAVYDHERAGIPPGTTGIADVSGLGDGAFSQITGSRAAINFDKDDALVVIGLTTTATTPTQDQLTTLATAAAGRI